METTQTADARSLRWYEIWWDVYRHPSEKTFIRILADPGVSPKRAYLWLVVMGVLMGIYVSTRPSVPFDLVRIIRFMIKGPILICILATIGALMLHWCTNILGGQGDYDRLFFALGAVICPVYLIQFVLVILFSSNATLAFLIQNVINLYSLYLVILATKAEAKLNGKRAVIAVIIPGLIVGGLVFCAISRGVIG